MRIIIEEQSYSPEDVKETIEGLDIEKLKNNNQIKLNYVGYYYNPQINDYVFFLPKVVVDSNSNKVFNEENLTPEDIIKIDEKKNFEDEKKFIFDLMVWITLTITRYNKEKDNQIVYQKQIEQTNNNTKNPRESLLETIFALLKFNKENQNFFLFIFKNLHSGLNKINWNRTIVHSPALFQKGEPIYLKPINKKRQINFDEELLVLFFSILNYIHITYGFPVKINENYELITGEKFEHYLKEGYGLIRLHQIKYKHFSDKALQLWQLCYNFFARSFSAINSQQAEYLLVKNFNIVFEAIMDDLIGDKNLEKLKGLEDGKIIDHIYQDKSLITNKDVYYIGDSKYYGIGNSIEDKSIYKQFTYARNIIQWDCDNNKDVNKRLRDDETEGYDVVPNFFISANMNDLKSDTDGFSDHQDNEKIFSSSQFENRLFDRDTLYVYHFDVNFLYVVKLYARNNSYLKEQWKKKVHGKIREKIVKKLNDKYNFYIMTKHDCPNSSNYIKEHFQEVLGKIYKIPKGSYILALEKRKEEIKEEIKEKLKNDFKIEDTAVQ